MLKHFSVGFTQSVVPLIVLIFNFAIFAQDNSSYLLEDDVIVSASRYEQDQFKAPEAISTLNNSQIELMQTTNTAYALFGTSGIWMQQTNNGGGSPFVRGLTGNQTLIMIDGIRLNNSTFRYGPNQYLNTINTSTIERVEIMRGSGSVQYGSDALGGTIHFITKAPTISSEQNTFDIGLNAKYLSDNMQKSGFMNFDYSSSTIGFTGLVSYKNYGDVLSGGDVGLQIPSSYNEYAASVKSILKVTDSYYLTLAYDYLKQSDVDRYDQVTQRGYEYYKFDPQVRELAYLRNNFVTNSDLFQDVAFTLSWQLSDETRKRKKENSPVQTFENDKVNVFGANLETVSQFSNKWKASSGAEIYHDYVNSGKETENLSDGSVTYERGLYANGSKALNFSVYTLHNYILHKTGFDLGLRYSASSVDIQDETFGDVKISPMALTSHLSVQYYLTNDFQLIGRINTAFRTPNINDLSSFGSFDYGIEVPNENLDPERSINFEAGFKAKSEKVSGSLFLYRNNLSNLIDRVKTAFEGDSTYQGENVYKKENVGEAYVQGIEGELTYYFITSFSFYTNLTYTFGQNISKDEPMRRIPPLNGNLTLIYQRSLLKVSLEFLFATKQDRLSSGDVDDHRIPDGGTPGWQVLNFYGSYKIDPLTFSIGFLNIFNEEYRTHGSGINGIGRSIYIAARLRF